MGKDFKGVYNLYDKSLLLFNPNQKATEEDYLPLENLNDDIVEKRIRRKRCRAIKRRC